MSSQPAVLTNVPSHASFLFFDLAYGVSAEVALLALAGGPHPDYLLIGFGPGLLEAAGAEVDGVRPMPSPAGRVPIPRTPFHLFARIEGSDPGVVLHRERTLVDRLSSHFDLVDRVDGFKHGPGLDLTGYEDGTENPTGEEATHVALASGRGPGLDGSTVVAVQRWLHDLDVFGAHAPAERDAIIGRAHQDNHELDDPPMNAHVKRAAQEDFTPEAFMVRRSMPWRDHRGAGLVFVAFGATLDPFEAVLRRMAGTDDGVVDALFGFTRPVSGAVFWCPPVREGALDLRAVV